MPYSRGSWPDGPRGQVGGDVVSEPGLFGAAGVPDSEDRRRVVQRQEPGGGVPREQRGRDIASELLRISTPRNRWHRRRPRMALVDGEGDGPDEDGGGCEGGFVVVDLCVGDVGVVVDDGGRPCPSTGRAACSSADQPVLLDGQARDDQSVSRCKGRVGMHAYALELMRCRTTWQSSASADTAAAEPHSTAGAACAATSSEPMAAPSAEPR